MSVTYKQLAEEILKMTPEQQAMTATVSCDLAEEAIPVKSLHIITSGDFLDGVIDEGHPVLTIDF